MKTCHKILFVFLLLGVVAGVAVEGHAVGRIKRIKQGIFLYSNWDAPYLTLDSCLDKSVTQVTVPDVVTWYGREYLVAEIGPGAFGGCHNLITLELNNKISFLKGALLGCPNLRVIKINSKEPPLLESMHPFYGGKWDEVIEPYHTLTTIIVVPKGCEELYRNATGWKEFKVIMSHMPTGNELKIDEIDMQINSLESQLQKIQQEEQRIKAEIDALRKAKSKKSIK